MTNETDRASPSDDIKGQLNEAWENDQMNRVWGLLANEVMERCINRMVSVFNPNLVLEVAEDCYQQALENVIKRLDRITPGQDNEVPDLYNYVFMATRNEINDYFLEDNRHSHVDMESAELDPDSPINPDPSKWNPESVIAVAESAAEAEVTAHGMTKLSSILGICFSNLNENEQRVLLKLLKYDATMPNRDLCDVLGEAPERGSTVRSWKYRMLKKLASLMPRAARELGLDFDDILFAGDDILVFNESYEIMSDEEDVNSG